MVRVWKLVWVAPKAAVYRERLSCLPTSILLGPKAPELAIFCVPGLTIYYPAEGTPNPKWNICVGGITSPEGRGVESNSNSGSEKSSIRRRNARRRGRSVGPLVGA